MMKAASRHLRAHWYYYLFGLTVLCTLYMNAYIARTLLDGDASGLLYQAYTMAQNHKLVEYFGTNELYFLGVPSYFVPFFKVFSNWTLVRFCGTALLQALYALSFLYLAAQAKVSKPARWIAASLLLMPFSTAYARNVLYHLYYIVYITYSFLLIGLLLRLLNTKAGEKRKAILPFCAMGILWIIVGMNGVRHLMILVAPLLILTFILLLMLLKRYTFRQGKLVGDGPLLEKPPARLLKLLLLSCLFFSLGYLIHQTVLLPLFQISNSQTVSLFAFIVDAQRIARIFNHFFVSIGMRISTLSVVSLRGVSFVLAGLSFGYLLWASWRHGFRERSLKENFSQTIVYGFFLTSLLLTVVIFVFDSTDRWFEMYYVPALVPVFPVLALEIDRLKECSASCARKLLIFLTCFAFLFQGGYTAYHLLHKNSSKLDIWSGLPMENVMIVESVQDCVEFMHTHGYTHGIAPYWHANVMAEYSDGTLVVVLYRLQEPGEPVALYRWGPSYSAFQQGGLPEKLVLFIEKENVEEFLQSYPQSVQVHQGAFFVGLEVDAEWFFPQ